jgi:hypothetical protein
MFNLHLYAFKKSVPCRPPSTTTGCPAPSESTGSPTKTGTNIMDAPVRVKYDGVVGEKMARLYIFWTKENPFLWNFIVLNNVYILNLDEIVFWWPSSGNFTTIKTGKFSLLYSVIACRIDMVSCFCFPSCTRLG